MHRHPRLMIPALLTLALLSPRPSAAAVHHLTLDPGGTEITFILEATGHDVHGSMALESGELRLDPETGSASGSLRLDATRAETGNDSRDKTMHRKVLESATYPYIVFVARSVDGSLPAAGKGEIEVGGVLSIHGDEHALILPVTLDVRGDRFTATTRLTIPYVEWGMKDPSIVFLRVAKEVQVSATATGTLSRASERGSGEEP